MPKSKRKDIVSNTKKSSLELLFLIRCIKLLLLGTLCGLILVSLLSVFSFPRKHIKSKPQNYQTQDPNMPIKKSLPKGWSVVNPTPKGTLVKFVNDSSQSSLKPNVVLIKNTISSKNYNEYTDQLIHGSQSTITTLVFFDDNTTEQNGYYVRSLSGYYYNGAQKIMIVQNILIKDLQLYMISASYESEDSTASTDIEKIVKNVSSFVVKK